MLQKDLNAENKEIRSKAYELYENHGSKDGNDSVDWLEAERQMEERSRAQRNAQLQNILLAIVGILCVIVALRLITLLKKNPPTEVSAKSLSDLKVMMLVHDSQDNEKVAVFGDTHFDFGQSALSQEAKTLLDADVQILQENPLTHVRIAGYTSAQGSEDVNQKLSEKRAHAVRDYLIERGFAPERITIIGYGRTKPALYEATPGAINSKEALADMRVLFEVVVQ